MDLQAYQTTARSTAIYPDIDDNYIYPTLGLLGESCELYEKYVEIKRENNLEKNKEELIKEAGDLSWYIANLAWELTINMIDLNDEPEKQPTDPDEIMSYIIVSSGKIAERIKKVIRDKEGIIGEKEIKDISDELSNVLTYLRLFCKALDSDFETALQTNINKLQSRAKRNVLQGDGDNR